MLECLDEYQKKSNGEEEEEEAGLSEGSDTQAAA
jgi:hypothetical protein